MLRVVLSPSALSALRKLEPEVHAAVVGTLSRVPAAFGRPHAHLGIGLRQLRPNLYEARTGLGLRIVLQRYGEFLVVKVIGDHDEIRAYLKGKR